VDRSRRTRGTEPEEEDAPNIPWACGAARGPLLALITVTVTMVEAALGFPTLSVAPTIIV